jgi:hypothetical protein
MNKQTMWSEIAAKKKPTAKTSPSKEVKEKSFIVLPRPRGGYSTLRKATNDEILHAVDNVKCAGEDDIKTYEVWHSTNMSETDNDEHSVIRIHNTSTYVRIFYN